MRTRLQEAGVFLNHANDRTMGPEAKKLALSMALDLINREQSRVAKLLEDLEKKGEADGAGSDPGTGLD